ncbi:hypothetical protein SAMN04488524_3232 [Pedobacter africanus]|uniref:Uncharacterized protein n=1 Tax=Pedobacter africanus TaxID=151894 RepID=A0A1W2CTZ4_9SPHI|nr:hypothetical protein SAMN04488524_3232 [Pedobacter africanus]
MRTKKIQSGKLIKISETALLSLIANRLHDRMLFPEKVEEAKRYIRSIKVSTI